jgi:transposase
MDATFLVLRTGCQWNALNATGICSSSSAHRRFQEWVQAGVFLELWKRGLLIYDELQGIDWSWLAMDGAMTKSPLGGEKTGKNPTDRAKRGTTATSRRSRQKRSLLTEASGIPISLAVDGANRNDFKMARQTIENMAIERPEPTEASPQGMCLDKGYDYNEVRDLLSEFGFTAHIRTRGEEAKSIKSEAGYRARRWVHKRVNAVVERTHSWMNRFRGLLVRWCKKPENYLAFLHIVCAYITFKRAGQLG